MNALLAFVLASPLTPLEHAMRSVLDWFHTTLGLSWAWSIVATTVVVRMLLVPLTVRQIHSMQNLQRFAPQMKEIQKKYKQDKQKQNEELMKFYRENSINPAASCLPMLAQFPVFIALYYALRHFASEPASQHPGSLSWLHFVPSIAAHTTSFWGGYVLLVVYVGSQMASTLYMSATVDKMQRRLFMLMPLVFVFVIAHFPAGLVLYWMTTNLWTVGQGLITRRLIPKTPAPSLSRRSSRTPPKDEPEAAEQGEERAQPARPATPPRKVRRKKGRADGERPPGGGPVDDPLTVEATGETVGEAKWAALRELEQRYPGLDRSAVRFEVVSEGERGLLGVGYSPARVVGHLPIEAAEAARLPTRVRLRRMPARSSRGSSRRSASRRGSTCTRTTRPSPSPAPARTSRS